MPTLEEEASRLGVSRGGELFVHSSIKAVGLGVRAEELIAALRACVGEEGTLLFPTFTSRNEEYFDPENTPSAMGVVTEVFRRMPETLRSRHPRHPVAAQGPKARELIENHENAIGPCGEGTPFEKHARMGGQVLMIGVDLDTLTLLHTAEALLALPYLNELEGKHVDPSGCVRTVLMRQAPGGHRGGVFGIEKELRKRRLIRYGSLGRARTMLMSADAVLSTLTELLQADPAAALCPNDFCPDCVDFKSKIRAWQLAKLGAKISIVLPRQPESPRTFAEMVGRFLPGTRVTLASNLEIVRLSRKQRPPVPPNDGCGWVLQPAPLDLIEIRNPPPGYTGFAYAPLEAARAGLQPFYDVLHRAKCRESITDILIEDGITGLQGTCSPALGYLKDLVADEGVALGDGHAQLREIVSASWMRGFRGCYHLIVPEGNPYLETSRLLKEFWKILP